MTIRSQIIDAIVTVYGGASAVVRAPVRTYYDELKDLTNDTLTGITTPEPEDVTKTGYQKYSCELPVRVERVTAYENETDWRARAAARQAQAETILGDITSTAAAADRTLGGLCHLMDYAGGNILIPDEENNTVGAFIILRVRYDFSILDPDSA